MRVAKPPLRHDLAVKVFPNGHAKGRQGESAERGDDLNASAARSQVAQAD